ncbi:hypothetical protein BDF21DRAFT_448118 [Thamnidium elegans]|uniref:Uncharacterized protein n=1 Tax=Thamnidium elegans TaxID=101142 RepID=A0A8H7SZD8_9FUNG|nr:hypothetical protein INT48_001779 [Thamnidium elegans]KAI8095996.1 hypothetical protein BDF21DRAFT_448118 [Thamnidium elegans]
MHLPTLALSLLGVSTTLIFQTFAALNNHLTNDASNFHQLNPASGSFQRPRGDLQPVSYLQNLRGKRLYNKSKLEKKSLYNKRDYATTLRYLRAAMSSYRKDLVTPPPAQLIQLEQQLPPAPVAEPFFPPPAPPAVEQAPVGQAPTVEQTLVPELPVTPSPTSTEVTPPSLPDTSSSTDTALDATMTTVVLSNGRVESIPLSVDLEEGDIFDPEEDPDDVDEPPFVNGKPVDREE